MEGFMSLHAFWTKKKEVIYNRLLAQRFVLDFLLHIYQSCDGCSWKCLNSIIGNVNHSIDLYFKQ